MKKAFTYLLAFIIPAIFVSDLFAQTNVASVNARAGVVHAITITKTTDLNFGNLSVGSTGGTVVYDPNTLSRTASAGSSITLPSVTGNPTLATFTVSGESLYSFIVTLPSTTLTLDDGLSHTMTVNSFTSNLSSSGSIGTLNSSGTATLTVGATLNVNANQYVGTYNSTIPFTILVNYN